MNPIFFEIALWNFSTMHINIRKKKLKTPKAMCTQISFHEERRLWSEIVNTWKLEEVEVVLVYVQALSAQDFIMYSIILWSFS